MTPTNPQGEIMNDREEALRALEELADLMDGVVSGDYKPDSFTTQPAREAITRLAASKEAPVSGDTSDGYHTFNELYDFRMTYNALLFNEWAASGKHNVHKSKRHHDGEECFGGGWFIVVALLPTGQITNHYRLEYWNLFKIPEAEMALFEYDGHTPADTLVRMKALEAPWLWRDDVKTIVGAWIADQRHLCATCGKNPAAFPSPDCLVCDARKEDRN